MKHCEIVYCTDGNLNTRRSVHQVNSEAEAEAKFTRMMNLDEI